MSKASSAKSSAHSSAQSSRAASPRAVSPRALSPMKPGNNKFNKLAAITAWGLATGQSAADFLDKNPFVKQLLGAAVTGAVGYGAGRAITHRVETVKAQPVYGVPKDKAPDTYYGKDTAIRNPYNYSVSAKCLQDPKYCPTPTPTPTPTPSITNPMNNTQINVVNKNA